jgi:predicted secreted protein
MSITTVVAIYFLIWWLTLFAVLPWGIRNQEEDGLAVEPGTDPGAPALHVMWRKLGWTTLVATIIFGALYVAYTRNLLPFDWLVGIITPPRPSY